MSFRFPFAVRYCCVCQSRMKPDGKVHRCPKCNRVRFS